MSINTDWIWVGSFGQVPCFLILLQTRVASGSPLLLAACQRWLQMSVTFPDMLWKGACDFNFNRHHPKNKVFNSSVPWGLLHSWINTTNRPNNKDHPCCLLCFWVHTCAIKVWHFWGNLLLCELWDLSDPSGSPSERRQRWEHLPHCHAAFRWQPRRVISCLYNSLFLTK